MDFSQEVVVPVRTHPASAGEEVHAESDDERRGRSVVDPADRHRPVVRLSADDYPVVAGLVDIAGEGSHVLPRRHAECDSRTLGGLGQGERRTVRSTSRRSEYRVAVPSILADAIFLGRPEQVSYRYLLGAFRPRISGHGACFLIDISREHLPLRCLNLGEQSVKGFVLLRRRRPLSQSCA